MARESSNDVDSVKQGNSPDPYLRAFLRQAVAMISSERGINDATYNKLHLMAQQLGLSDAAFNTAIDRLKEPDSQLGLHRYEREFVQFLAGELEKIRGDVLTVEDESRVIALAKSRYEIDAVRAYQLIHKTASQKNVGMICHLDAQRFALNLVREAAENPSLTDPANRKRLYHACAKWGLGQEEVDQTLYVTLAKKRRERRRRISRVAILAIVGAGLLTALLFAGRQFVPWEKPAGDASAETTPTTDPHATESVDNPYLPWWDIQLQGLADQLRRQSPAAAPLIQNLTTADDRKPVYEQLLNQAFAGTADNALLNPFLAAAFLLDPDDQAAMAILGQIAALLSPEPDDTIPTPAKIRQSLGANRLLGSIHTSNTALEIAGRREKADELIGESFAIISDTGSATEYEASTVPVLTLNQWNQASAYIQTNPAKVAALVPELDRRIESRNNLAINEIRTPVLLTVLALQPYQWESLRDSIAIAIDKSDPPKTMAWSDFLLTTEDRSLSEYVLEKLATRLQLDTEGYDRMQMLDKVRDYCTNYRLRKWQPAIQAQQRLDHEIEAFERQLHAAGIQSPTDDIFELRQTDLPPLIAAAARINNLALSWMTGASQEGNFSRFDSLMDAIVAEPMPLDSSDGDQIPPDPTASRIRTLNENLDKLFNSSANRVTARISALQSLSRSASFFSGIDYPTAAKLAEYIFADKEPAERLAVERALPNFSHWPQLKLAILDLFESSELELDSLLNVLNRLGLQDMLMVERGDWKDQIPLEILSDVAAQLQQSPELSASRNWKRLDPILEDIYRRRIEVITQRSPLAGKSPLPLELIDAVEQLGFDSGLSEDNHWSNALQWLRSLQKPDGEKLVLTVQLLASMLNDLRETERPLLSSRYAKALQQSRYDNGQRLLAVELLLMQVLQAHRNDWQEQISQ